MVRATLMMAAWCVRLLVMGIVNNTSRLQVMLGILLCFVLVVILYGTYRNRNGESYTNVQERAGSGLPPDPGEAGRGTLAGVDVDADGIRDDIQRYIALTYADSPRTQAGLRQLALALGVVLIEAGSKTDSVENTTAFQQAIECLYYVRPDSARTIKNELLARMLNTKSRTKAYAAFNDDIAGEIFLEAGPTASPCRFDPGAYER